MEKNEMYEHEAMHYWFELSYAQYLTIPRTALQSMPDEWQKKFAILLDELDTTIDWRPKEKQQYQVQLRQIIEKNFEPAWGPVIRDPLQDYERGRRKLPLLQD